MLLAILAWPGLIFGTGYALRYPGLACIGGGRLVRHHRKSCVEDCKILIQSLLLVYNMVNNCNGSKNFHWKLCIEEQILQVIMYLQCGLQITVGCGGYLKFNMDALLILLTLTMMMRSKMSCEFLST